MKQSKLKTPKLKLPKSDIVEKVVKIKPKDKQHYVNSREFEELIRDFYNTNVVSDKLAESINKIANGLSYAPNFINYSFKGDFIGDAVLKMFIALKNKKFRLDSGFSPFSYFTTISFHAFINRIKKEKKHHETIENYKKQTYFDIMSEEEVYTNPDNCGIEEDYN